MNFTSKPAYPATGVFGARRFEWIDAGRGVASLSVVAFHAAAMMHPIQYSGRVGLDNRLNILQYGVEFFFALSGFIIWYSHASWLGAREKTTEFIVRRIFRIWPTYLFVVAITLIINQFQRDKLELSFGILLKQILLIDIPLWVGPAWTLQFEIYFYALFAVLIYSIRFGVIAMAAVAIGLIYRYIYDDGDSRGDFFQVLTNSYIVIFVLGALAANCVLVNKTRQALIFGLAFSLVSSFAVLVLEANILIGHGLLVKNLILGVWFSTIVLALYCLDVAKIKAPNALVYMGDISYSLYISHIIVIGVVYAMLSRAGVYSILTEVLLVGVALLFSIMVSSMICRGVEKPGIALGRRAVIKLTDR